MVTARIVHSEEELRRVVEAVPLSVAPTAPLAPTTSIALTAPIAPIAPTAPMAPTAPTSPTAPTAPITIVPLLNDGNNHLIQHSMSNPNYGGENSFPQYSTTVGTRSMTAGEESHQLQEESTSKINAGIAGAIVGLLFGGPIGAIILGFGTAHYTEKDGAAGDTARAMADLALSARSSARQLNEKHHFVDKSKEVAYKAWEKAKEIDREHHVVDKSRRLILDGFYFFIGVISQVMEKISENQQGNRTSQRR